MPSLTTTSTLELLSRIIRFDTVSLKPNLELVKYIESYLRIYGLDCELIANQEGTKESILCRIGPEAPSGVILSAHTDVVPPDGQRWSNDPFTLVVKNGRAYGRGSCDMKGFLASVLAAVPRMITQDLKAPIYLAFSYDEEVGCAGVASLIDLIISKDLAPHACIVGEPTGMKPVTAHTGKQVFECSFKGTPIHSSLSPLGINAITQAGAAIHHLNRFALSLEQHDNSDKRFPISHPTINIGTIRGGKAPNIVAEDCSFLVEYRYPPGAPPDLLRNELATLSGAQFQGALVQGALAPGRSCVHEIVSYPSYTAKTSSSALALVSELQGPCAPLAVNYGTEAGLYSDAGIDTVVFGPGDIRQAHQPDEFIEILQLSTCDNFITRLTDKLTAPGWLA